MTGRGRNVLVSNAVFRRLWCARAVSFVGDGIALTALVLYVQGTEGTGTAVAALLLAQALPHLLGPFAGTFADRVDQRSLMIGCDLGRCRPLRCRSVAPALDAVAAGRDGSCLDVRHAVRTCRPRRGPGVGRRRRPGQRERVARDGTESAGGRGTVDRRGLGRPHRGAGRAGGRRGELPALGPAAARGAEAASSDAARGTRAVQPRTPRRPGVRPFSSGRAGRRGDAVPGCGVRRHRQRRARLPGTGAAGSGAGGVRHRGIGVRCGDGRGIGHAEPADGGRSRLARCSSPGGR